MNCLRAFIIAILFLLHGVTSAWAEGIDYTVSISGIEDNGLENSLKEKAFLFKLADKKPETAAALNRRIKNDLKTFKAVMEENGYYGAVLDYTLQEENNRKHIILTIDPGQIYTITEFILRWPDGEPADVEVLSALKLPVGEPALPGTILDTEQTILTTLMQNGFPFPQTSGRKLSVNHTKKSVSAELFLDPGMIARFGPFQITGLKRVKEAFVERRIRWQEGEVFNIQKIASTRKALTRSGVVSSADIQYGEIAQDGQVPVTLDIRESKHRSIGAGAAYSTTLELVGNVFWEHRNLFGQAEKLRVKAEGGTATYALGADLNKPDMFGNTNLSWQNSAEFRQEFLEAYDKDTASLSTALNYKYSATSAVSSGVTIERSRIKEEGNPEQIFTLLALPLTYRYDGTDDLLDPREGIRANIGVTPYQVLNEQNSFIKVDAGLSHYLPVGKRFVWANRVRAAVVQGQTLEDVPADKRLYAGGGGSVRGYGYQLLGPLDENNNPTGGRMAFEVGTEGRFKITETIEGVAFLEGGRVSEDSELNSNADFLWGTGSGVRYHTPIGPLRVDLAVPLDKRKPDDAFQFYISLGQAF